MRRLIIIFGAGTLLISGCGGGGEDSKAEDSELSQALATAIYDEGSSGVVSEEDAQCVADEIVSGVGVDRLTELGVTPEDAGNVEDYDFSDDEIGVIVDAFFGCVDVASAVAQEISKQFNGEGLECITENLDEDVVRQIVTIGLSDPNAEAPEELGQAIVDIAAACDLPMS